MSTRLPENVKHLQPKRIAGESVAMYEVRTRTGLHAPEPRRYWPTDYDTETLELRKTLLEAMTQKSDQEREHLAAITAELKRRRQYPT